MRVRYFTVPVLDSEAAERELNAFLATHRVSNVEQEIVSLGVGAVWAVAVTYQAKPSTASSTKPGKSKIDYREVLPPEQFAVYAKLRSLRKEVSEAEGVPAYSLFTNERACGVSQLERPRQPQRQPGLPPGPSSETTAVDPDPTLLPSVARCRDGKMTPRLRCVGRAAAAVATARRSLIFVP